MKKSFLKFFTTVVLGCQMFMFNKMPVSAYSNAEIIAGKSIAPEKAYNEVRKIELGKGLECVMKFKYWTEYIKSIDDQGNKLYNRYVSAVGTLYSNKDGVSAQKLLEHRIKVVFTYDKKSLVKIDNAEEDIDCYKAKLDSGKKRWKMAQTYEILYDEGICIVSEMFTVFKQQKLTDRIKYVENSHVDFMCTPQGNIAINSKSI